MKRSFHFPACISGTTEAPAAAGRAKIRKLHGLAANEIDLILTEIATHAIVREPEARTGAPDAKDNHLWSLLHGQPGSVLVTGDLALARNPPPLSDVLSPHAFAASISR